MLSEATDYKKTATAAARDSRKYSRLLSDKWAPQGKLNPKDFSQSPTIQTAFHLVTPSEFSCCAVERE
jgi:hypothetical protein